MPHVKPPNLKTMLERLLPSYRRDIARSSKAVHDILMVKISHRFNLTKDTSNKAMVDFAVQDVVSEKEFPTSELIDILIANVKMFLSAGHETTGQTM